nr:hypothetical protein [Tanacetum cinerariifolium]
MRHGFDLGYKIRVHHGEPDLPPPPPVIDNTRQPQMSDMTMLLKDLSYILLNNEHNEPTQGDIGETSNEPTQDTYMPVPARSCTPVVTINGYKLPPSYYAIKKTFKMIGLGYESIHACEHDCCLFRGDDNKDLDFCPVCNTSRWKDSNTPRNHTAKEMIWHATGKCTVPESSFMLTLLIPGPKSLGKDIDVYLRPLIKDLKVLWDQKEDDMLKAQIKVVDILCDLELIYPPDLFDIIIHLVIHIPIEALEGGPIRPRWMFPFERYIKKLKGYVRNKAKPEGSIAEGYVAEEALTFSSHYFRDVTTKFNRPDRNVDPPPPTYLSMSRTQRQRPKVSTTSELFALACGPTWTPILINSCIVDVVRYVVHSCNERHTTQNNDICSPGYDGEMYYGQLQEILEFKYLLFKVGLFRVKWFDTQNQGRKVKRLVLRNNMTQIDTIGEAFKNDQYILVTQVKKVFYLKDKAKPHWKVVEHVNHKKFSDGGVIVVEDNPDIIHYDNSYDLPLSTSLNDLDNATLHIDGQSTEVDAPPYIIDVVDEDDDIIDAEDALPHDLADSDDEDLINVDDDGVEKVYSCEEED